MSLLPIRAVRVFGRCSAATRRALETAARRADAGARHLHPDRVGEAVQISGMTTDDIMALTRGEGSGCRGDAGGHECSARPRHRRSALGSLVRSAAGSRVAARLPAHQPRSRGVADTSGVASRLTRAAKRPRPETCRIVYAWLSCSAPRAEAAILSAATRARDLRRLAASEAIRTSGASSGRPDAQVIPTPTRPAPMRRAGSHTPRWVWAFVSAGGRGRHPFASRRHLPPPDLIDRTARQRVRGIDPASQYAQRRRHRGHP